MKETADFAVCRNNGKEHNRWLERTCDSSRLPGMNLGRHLESKTCDL